MHSLLIASRKMTPTEAEASIQPDRPGEDITDNLAPHLYSVWSQGEETRGKKLEETNETHHNLTRAKDKAQLAATTAMSIVNVALLKELLDQGAENAPYFLWSLCLISTSLALQIIAGFLSIYTAHLLNYAKVFGANFCDDVTHNVCPCICTRESRAARVTRDSDCIERATTVTVAFNEDLEDSAIVMESGSNRCNPSLEGERVSASIVHETDSLNPAENRDGYDETDRDDSAHNRCCCCCCGCSCYTLVCRSHVHQVHDPDEDAIISQHKSWHSHMLQINLDKCTLQQREEQLSEILNEKSKSVDRLQAEKSKLDDEIYAQRRVCDSLHDSSSENTQVGDIVRDTEKTIYEAKLRIELIAVDLEKCNEIIRERQEELSLIRERLNELELKEEKGRRLAEIAQSVRQYRAMKMADFWQGGINYILYTVFILNAIITGFGISGGPVVHSDSSALLNDASATDNLSAR